METIQHTTTGRARTTGKTYPRSCAERVLQAQKIPARRYASELEQATDCGSYSAKRRRTKKSRRPLKASTSAAEKLESKPRDYRYISPAPRARSHHRTTRARQPASAAHIKAARHNNHLQESGLAEESRTPQQQAVRVGSPAVRGPTPGHPTPRNPGRASAGASVVDQRHRTSSRLQQQGCPESVGMIGHAKIDTQICVLTKSRNFLTKTKSSRRTDETWG